MKLLRLKLNTPFRSLAAGFEVAFLREWDYGRSFEFHPYCLAGRNGSGKSNVLEALAAIFYHIECIYLDYRPDGFEFEAENNPAGFRARKPHQMPLNWSTSLPAKPWNRSNVHPGRKLSPVLTSASPKSSGNAQKSIG